MGQPYLTAAAATGTPVQIQQCPACAICGITGVTLYLDRPSGQKRCKQHRHLRACAECGTGGVTLYVAVDGQALCQFCRDDPVPTVPDAKGELRDLVPHLPLPAPSLPSGYQPRSGPARVTLELCLSDEALRALQALRLGEPLYKAAASVDLSNNGLKVQLGRAVIDAWVWRR